MYISKGEVDEINLAYYALVVAIVKKCNSAKHAYMLLGVEDVQRPHETKRGKHNEI